MKTFDVIIVGAGPAGAIAGYHLAKAGLDICLIDKSTFPRRKVCGGGLTERAMRELPFDISPVIHQPVSWGEVRFRGRLVKKIQRKQPIAYMIDRTSFDDYLLDQAIHQGAKCLLGERVTAITEQENATQVQGSQDRYHCKYLIGADGVHSHVAQQLGLMQNRATSLAYEALLTRQSNPGSAAGDAITFDFGTILLGYGWIFPKRDHLNVGVCRSWPGKRASKKHLLRFIHQHPQLVSREIINIRAYPVPLGGTKAQLHKNNALLIGDAANLADPWLGEGLYYAFASGRMAAETIQQHITGTLPNLSQYTQQIDDHLIQQMACARRLSLVVNLLPWINVSFLKRSSTLQRMTIDLLRGDQDYQDIWQALKAHPIKLLTKILQGK